MHTDDNDHIPDGVTEIDTHDDEMFSIALYARLLDNEDIEDNHHELSSNEMNNTIPTTRDAQTRGDPLFK